MAAVKDYPKAKQKIEEDAEERVLLVVPSDTHLDDSPNKLLKPEPKVLDDDDNVDEPTELGEGTGGKTGSASKNRHRNEKKTRPQFSKESSQNE